MTTKATEQELSFEQQGHKLAGWPDPIQRLRQALARNDLVLLCQPILSVRDPQKFEMGEVLVRLREEENSMLPPGDFLPAFEHYGMMAELDRWVAGSVVRQLESRPEIARLSINVSRKSLDDPDFVGFVAALLRNKGLSEDAVVFEIDESDVIGNSSAAERFARSAKQMGCQVLIDGFGQRAVTFEPFKSLSLDYVKVDGRIVRNILRREGALDKLLAIHQVSKSMGIGVIGECVEEQEVLAKLKSIGIPFAQGFGVHPPTSLH